MDKYDWVYTDVLNAPINSNKYWVYDLETFPTIFTATFYNVGTGQVLAFEISTRINHLAKLLHFLQTSQHNGDSHIGFNNFGFDYPIIHAIRSLGMECRLEHTFQACKSIINTPWADRFNNVIWSPEIRQIDLMKVMHYDASEGNTSLKMLECRMNMLDVKELPFEPETHIQGDADMDILLEYNWHDVLATINFFHEIRGEIEFRATLSKKYDLDFTNDSNTKIGAKIFKHKLHAAGIECNKYLRTPRDSIDLAECIVPNIKLRLPEFQDMQSQFEAMTIRETKGVFVDRVVWVDNIEYVFGVGGLHASAQDIIFREDEAHIIMLVDVKSYYPNLSIKNEFYPEHLGIGFCKVNDEVYQERSTHAKGTVENASLKEALNSTFGNSNQVYSDFYDPKFTMTTTISGQLSLLMLVEPLIAIEGVKIININTDGICIFAHQNKTQLISQICNWWKTITRLDLSTEFYTKFFSRNVNNYIAVGRSGNVTRKGLFLHSSDLRWSQNHSQQVVSKVADKVMVNDENLEDALHSHRVLNDFIIHTQVARSHSVYQEGSEVRLPKVIRYIACKAGDYIYKTMPPKGIVGTYKRKNSLTDEYYESIASTLEEGAHDERIHTKNKSVYSIRKTFIGAGTKFKLCTNLNDISMEDIDYDYYKNEIIKLTEGWTEHLPRVTKTRAKKGHIQVAEEELARCGHLQTHDQST